jgi:hypothetical protein
LETEAKRQALLRFVVIADGRDSGMMNLLNATGLDGADVIKADFRVLKLQRVPTLAIVDQAGLMWFVHEGKLGETQGSGAINATRALTAGGSTHK